MRYNYYYDGRPIQRNEFVKNVPYGWENICRTNGEYSYGYFKAVIVEE